jgi:poly(3-hydroxybutyrate) depolymerase
VRKASAVLAASLAIAASGGIAPSAAAASTVTGASQATCTPSPCLSATGFTQYTLENVPNGDGTASTREYAVERPQNLAPSPANLAAAVVVFYEGGNCGLNGVPAGRFGSLAAEQRFVVVYMEVPCARGDNNWDKRNVDPETSSAVNDEPYVTAVVHAITQCPSSGAQPNQCVDPQRVYAAGTSSGGNMTADVMCDVENSPLFRGYLIDSSSLQLFEGAPACPSRNRSFFVMMALSNYGIDGGLYYDTAPSPHLDVPLFADWAASRLGCESRRIDDAIGSPVASTLRYVYSGPCAYAVAGSQAVVTLGVQNGGHTWYCQDSDAAAPTPHCPGIPDPPGLTPNGLPYTNGLFVEEDFWNFVAQSVSTEASAPELAETVAPAVSLSAPADGSTVSKTVSIEVRASDDQRVAGVRLELDGADLGTPLPAGAPGSYVLSWDTTAVSNGNHTLRALATDAAGNLAIASSVLTVENTASAGSAGAGGGAWLGVSAGESAIASMPFSAPASLVALGDSYSSGDGNAPYLPGTDTARDRCHRSTGSYPFVGFALLAGRFSRLTFRACAGAKVADFYGSDSRDGEPRQLRWIDRTSGLVSVSVGWDDALLPEILQSCARDGSRCEQRWRARAGSAIAAIAARSPRSRGSLYALYRNIASLAPYAQIVVFGYPRLFPSRPPVACAAGARGPSFTRGSMEWIDSDIRRLDSEIESAARAAHVRYVGASYNAFDRHERCTRRPDARGALAAARASPRDVLDASFTPNRRGQTALARLLESSSTAAG